MSVHPTPMELGDFAFEVLERPGPNEWFALVTPRGEAKQATAALRSELLALDEVELAHIHAQTADELAGYVPEH